MKKIILAILLSLAALPMIGQEYNFKLEKGLLCWQKIYESETNIDALLVNSGKFSDVNNANGVISARMIPVNVDLNGRSIMSVPIFIRDSNMACFVRIQQKEGRYRVTVDNFVFYDRYEEDPSGIVLEFWYIRNDTIKPAFFKQAAPIIDEMLTELFQPTKELDNDW